MEEQIKRARQLLSNAFYATNSKLNIMDVCSKIENEKEFKISKSINIADIFNISQAELLSPHMSKIPQNTCENEGSPSSPSILPTLANMSTFANLSYSSGNKISSMRQDFHDSSPIPSSLTVHGTPDLGFKKHVSPANLKPTHDDRKHLTKVTNKPLKAIKRNQSPDYSRELTKIMRRSHNGSMK